MLNLNSQKKIPETTVYEPAHIRELQIPLINFSHKRLFSQTLANDVIPIPTFGFHFLTATLGAKMLPKVNFSSAKDTVTCSIVEQWIKSEK